VSKRKGRKPPAPEPAPLPADTAAAQARRAALETDAARRRVLAQWRRVDPQSEVSLAPPSGRLASDVLPGVLKSLGLDRKRAEIHLVRVWNELVDPTVAAHAQPTGLVRGTLFVTVDSDAWKHEIIVFRRKELLDRLQQGFGRESIQRISFRVG
jgi:predicted nucleic acid-binding Zn ribbon protein